MSSTTGTRRKASTDATVRTIDPPGVEGRHKTVFRDSQEVAHAWAQNRQRFGRNPHNNFYFDGGVIFSYGRHFPAGRHVETVGNRPKRGRFIASRTYSSTTAGHMSDVRRAVQGHDGPTFYVHNVLANTVAEHRENLAEIRGKVAALLVKAGKARKNGPGLLVDAARLVAEANAYAAFVGIRDRINDSDTADIAERAKKVEAEAAAHNRRQEAADRARLAEKLAEWAPNRDAWLRGELDTFPRHPMPYSEEAGAVLLRIKRTDGGRPAMFETSLSARVPIAAGVPLLAAVRGTAEIPPGTRVGDFTFDGIDRVKEFVKVGCHNISFAEVERMGAELGL